MAELAEFKEFIKDKSANTIKSYIQQYNKLKKIVDNTKTSLFSEVFYLKYIYSYR